VTRLNDIQLALIIAKLYESDLPLAERHTHRLVLEKYVLGYTADTSSSADAFLLSMSYWLLKEYDRSLECLLQSTDSTQCPHSEIFNFYSFLKSHPYVVRHKMTQNTGNMSENVPKRELSKQEFRKLERKLYFTTACKHLDSGLPDIALEVLSMLPAETEGDTDEVDTTLKAEHDTSTLDSKTNQRTSESSNQQKETASSLFDEQKQTAFGLFDSNPVDSFDWNQPSSRFLEDEGYEIGISLDDSDDSDESDANDDANDDDDDTDDDHHHHRRYRRGRRHRQCHRHRH
jgi:hypothetical protein